MHVTLVDEHTTGCGPVSVHRTFVDSGVAARYLPLRHSAALLLLQPRYAVRDVLGVGGMSIVYEAFDTELQRPVAIKLLKSRASFGADQIMREARAIARLAHPNIVAVYDVGRVTLPSPDDGSEADRDSSASYLILERVKGAPLVYSRGIADWHPVIDLFVPVCAAVDAAHRAGVVHGDLKPQNVVVDENGRPRVLDFGLACLVDPAPTSMSRTLDESTAVPRTRVHGTPPYMAPELLRGETPSEYGDQFALCVMLFELLYGSHPFSSSREVKGIAKAIKEGNVAIPEASSRVPRHVHSIILRGLAREPEQRWPSVADMSAALKDVQLRRSCRGRMRGGWAFFCGATLSAVAAGAWLPGGQHETCPTSTPMMHDCGPPPVDSIGERLRTVDSVGLPATLPVADARQSASPRSLVSADTFAESDGLDSALRCAGRSAEQELPPRLLYP